MIALYNGIKVKSTLIVAIHRGGGDVITFVRNVSFDGKLQYKAKSFWHVPEMIIPPILTQENKTNGLCNMHGVVQK